MTSTMATEQEARVLAAIELIAQTPGYADAGADLSHKMRAGRIRFEAALVDRAQATLTGIILLGPEAMDSDALSLAQTLIHERYHLRQFPLEKTASFWLGVARRQAVMLRYERPAYQAALRFLDAVEQAFPERADAARRERQAIAATFLASYGAPLLP